MELCVNTKNSNIVLQYTEALRPLPEPDNDTLWISEINVVDPAIVAAALSNPSGQGPKVDSLTLSMRPCQPLVSTSPDMKPQADAADKEQLVRSEQMLEILQVSSITCKNGSLTIVTNVRLQEAVIIPNDRKRIKVVALVDDGASRNVMDTAYFEEILDSLRALIQGEALVGTGGNWLPTIGAWRGKIETGGVSVWAPWEIIDLGSSIKMILGWPWLRDVGVIHDYAMDIIQVAGEEGSKKLQPAQVHNRRREEVPKYGGAGTVQQPPTDKAQPAEGSTPSKPSVSFPLFGHAHCRTSSCWAVLAAEDNKSEDEDNEEHTAEEMSTEDSTPPSKEFLDDVLLLGQTFDLRWRKTRVERRRKMKER